MSATDELRRMLDERGVEYDTSASQGFWTDSNGHAVDSVFVGDTLFISHIVTPEQAIAATLGSGTCELICERIGIPNVEDAFIEIYTCSECGELMFSDYNYCPNCGRKVMDE